MGRIASPMQTLQIDYLCEVDECNKPMVYTPPSYTIPAGLTPASYPHRCCNDHTLNLDRAYPYLEYVKL